MASSGGPARSRPSTRRRRGWARTIVVALVAASAPWSALPPSVEASPTGSPALSSTPPPADADWLTILNHYRAASGVAPVAEEPSWSDGARKHLAYLANTPASYRTGPFASVHTENPLSPWYTVEGAVAAESANIGSGGSARTVIDRWMRAPFHAIGLLRPSLQRTGFATDASFSALDVIRGIGAPPSVPTTVVFPGDGASTYLDRGTTEFPDPREGCASDWQQFAGLPLIALLPSDPPFGTTATLRLPDGRTVSEGTDLCVQTERTYRSSDPIYGDVGLDILRGDNAVVVIPRARLSPGVHTVTISVPGGAPITWSFTVLAPPGVPSEVRALWAGSGKVHVGWQPPSSSGSTPIVSYAVRDVGLGATTAVDPTTRSAVLDVPPAPSGTVAVTAMTEWVGGPTAFDAWSRPHLPGAAGAGNLMAVPADAAPGTEAVLANLAMTDGVAAGYITADRCSRLRDEPQTKASGNHGTGEAIANLAVVPVDADGNFCLYSQVPTHLVVDVQGSFSTTGTLSFEPVEQVRLLDTRRAGGGRTGAMPLTGEIVRVETGAPAGTEAALVNLAMTDAPIAGYITADRCSALQPGPQTKASGNHGAITAIANLAVVPLDPDGSFCIYTQVPTHLVVDLQGTFSTRDGLGLMIVPPGRLLDTRLVGGGHDGTMPAQGEIVRVETGAPAGTEAALVNLAMTDAPIAGYITADRCSTLQPEPQTKASGNHGAITAIANLAVVPLDPDGSFCIYTQVPTHLVVDLQGTFSETGALRFSPISPAAGDPRVLDTRR